MQPTFSTVFSKSLGKDLKKVIYFRSGEHKNIKCTAELKSNECTYKPLRVHFSHLSAFLQRCHLN